MFCCGLVDSLILKQQWYVGQQTKKYKHTTEVL